MNSIFGALLNAQRRPDEEARRITKAMGAAILGPDGVLRRDAAAAAAVALDAVNQQIADEKSPRAAAPLSEHLGEFADSVPAGFTGQDAEPSTEPAVGLDARFLLPDDDVDTDAEPPIAEVPPWDTSPGDELIDVPVSADPASDGDENNDRDEEPPADPDEEDSDDKEPSADDSNDDAPTPLASRTSQQPPSPTDLYAAADSPWGDAAEIISPSPLTDDDDDEPDDGPVPSRRATDPPKDIDIPDPDPGLSLAQRIREWIKNVKNIWAERGKKLRLAVAGAAAIVVIVVIAMFSLSGHRGNPPDPAGAVAVPPAQSDNPEPKATIGPLLPSKVSASCGNDSDPVGPFANDNPKQQTRAWVCNRINGLDLNVLNITFDKPVVITAITIVPGWNYIAPDGRDEWSRHRLVTGVSWRMGGAVYPQVINTTRAGVTKQFASVPTMEMSMTITASTRPPMGKDQHAGIGGSSDADDASKVDETTAISEIIITGYPVNPGS